MKEELRDSNEVKTYLTFRMNEEVFAIQVSKVLSILEVIKITKVPKAKPFMKGVLNLRGSVLPVVDLRVKFGLPENENTKDTSIIVMTIQKYEDEVMLGSMVDSVSEVIEIKDSEIVPAPQLGTRYNSDVITGLMQLGEKFIMLLDIDKVFATEDLVINSSRSVENTVEI